MARLGKISQEISRYDRELYCTKKDGTICIFRKGYRTEAYDINGESLFYFRPSPYFVFALTHNWKMNGNPVDWGIEPIMARLKAMDLWKQRTIVDEIIEQQEKEAETKDRDLQNNIESFLIDFKRQFAKTFKDVNVSSLEKKDRRRKDDINLKQKGVI